MSNPGNADRNAVCETRDLTVRVNYDDERWHQIDTKAFTSVDSYLEQRHLPIRGSGVANVAVRCVAFVRDPTTDEVFSAAARMGIRVADFAETMEFLTRRQRDQRRGRLISLCGSFVGDRGRLAYVDAEHGGLRLGICSTSAIWRCDGCRFMLVHG